MFTTPLVGWNDREPNLCNRRLASTEAICHSRGFKKSACGTRFTHANRCLCT